eukprot:UN12666
MCKLRTALKVFKKGMHVHRCCLMLSQNIFMLHLIAFVEKKFLRFDYGNNCLTSNF